VAEDAIVTLVDTDSFQVNDGTTVYRCTVGKPEYTPPELQGMSFRDVDRSVEHDLFGLGVLIYQLLMEGTHPFGGVFRGQGEAPELKDRIKAGHFPHGRRGIPYNPMPLAPSFQMLPVALQELFLLCFEVGHGNPAARPTADVWSKALGVAEDGLVRCGVNGQHYYSGHLGVCPWCERAAKLGGRDPFPALGAIRSGQHLKPAAIGKAVEKPILKAKAISNLSPKNPPTTLQLNTPVTQIQINGNKASLKLSPFLKYTIVIFLVITIGTAIVTFLSTQFLSRNYPAFISPLKVTLSGHSDEVTSIAFSPDGKTIASGSLDKTIRLWNVNTDKATVATHLDEIYSVAFSPDGNEIYSVAFSPDGKVLADASGNTERSYINLLNMNTGEVISKLTDDYSGRLVIFHPYSKILAYVTPNGSLTSYIRLRDVNKREVVSSIYVDAVSVPSIAFSPDGDKIASSTDLGFIELWNVNTGKRIFLLDGRSGNYNVSSRVSSVVFSPDGNTLASGSWDNTIHLWSVSTGKTISTISDHSDKVTSVAFSPDGKILASGSADKSIRLRKADTGEIIFTLSGHTATVTSIAFSPDGKLLASGSADKTIKIWEVR
jgi:WD40 repeat protein